MGPQTDPPPRWRAVAVGAFLCAAALVMHGYPVVRPAMFDDDFLIVARSWTWPEAYRNLWLPHNEHALPLARLSTAAMVQIVGREPTALPQAAALQGPVAVVLGMVLAGVFVTRETSHVFYGLVAMLFFGLTQKYNEAVFWFSASLMVLALDTTLLALLAAQRWQRTGRPAALLLCGVWCALAPCWFASGILAGPLCALYLLPGRLRLGKLAKPQAAELLRAVLPLLGSVVYLALSVTFAGARMVRAEHHGGRSLLQVFNPVRGIEYSGRILVDNLVFGVHPATGHVASSGVVVAGLLVLAFLGWAWWRVAPHRRLLLLGLGFLFLNYALIYSFRADSWSYDEQLATWTRYNLFPYLGLIFYLCGGLPSRAGSLFTLDPRGDLTGRQCVALVLLAALLVAVQLPLAIRGHQAKNPDPAPQAECLQAIEAMDERCRAHRIDAATARAVLGIKLVPQCDNPPLINAWELLRGSDDPRPVSAEEAWLLLLPEAEPAR